MVAVLLLAAASYRSGKMLGKENAQWFRPKPAELALPLRADLLRYIAPYERLIEIRKGVWAPDNHAGLRVIATEAFVSDAIGYGGRVHLFMAMDIARDSLMGLWVGAHSETPSFVRWITQKGFLDRWNGASLQQLKNRQVDALTGATMTCDAIYRAVSHTGMTLLDESVLDSPWKQALTFENLMVLLVVVSGIVVSLLFRRRKRWRNIQLVLNVLVLGFWLGKFISLSSLLNVLGNGLVFWRNVGWIILIVVALVMPLLGQKRHYCNWVCPYGSVQDLAFKLTPRKIRLNDRMARWMAACREVILLVLLGLMWLGTGFELAEYEPFAAFLLDKADSVVMVLALLFVVLSVWIPRPWCRMMCPTGQLLQWCEKVKGS